MGEGIDWYPLISRKENSNPRIPGGRGNSAQPLLNRFSERRTLRVRYAHSGVHPPCDEGLEASLSAKVLYVGIVRGHVLPGIDLQKRAFRGIVVWRTIVFRPRQPPVVDRALLFAADLAMESFSPRHESMVQVREVGEV